MLDVKSIFNVLFNSGYQIMNCNVQALKIFVKENKEKNKI